MLASYTFVKPQVAAPLPHCHLSGPYKYVVGVNEVPRCQTLKPPLNNKFLPETEFGNPMVIDADAFVIWTPPAGVNVPFIGVPPVLPIINCPFVMLPDQDGTPELFVTSMALFALVISEIVLVALLYNNLFAVVVFGQTVVLHVGAVELPERSICPAVAVPARMAPAEAVE